MVEEKLALFVSSLMTINIKVVALALSAKIPVK
jgi:hypothetical protein